MRLAGGLSHSDSSTQPGSGIPLAHGLLRWVYFGRVTVAIVVFVAGAFYFRAIPPEFIVILAFAAIASVIASSVSLWYTHIHGAEPGLTFLYAQAVFDLTLVTTVVHVTEGPASQFPALYILVIAVSAVLMPFASSLLVTSLASLLYLGDIVFFQDVQLSVAVWLQVAVFVGVFVTTGFIASRVRVVGVERAALQQEVHRLRLEASDILRNIQSGVLTVDGLGTLIYVNPAARKLLGLPTGQLEGVPLENLLEDRAPQLVTAIDTTQRGPRKTVRSEGTVRLDDHSFPIGVTTTRIDVIGEGLPSVTAIFTDISDQKRLEAMRLRTERLEAVAELSASLAHEIKNPLASIRSSIEQLSASGHTDEDERFLAQLVIQESDRLSRLLSEFLDFSRVRVTNSRPIDLGQIAATAVDVVRKHPDCPDDVAIDLACEPTAMDGDEDLLHRVVANLVLNAIQASDGKARVTVEVRKARVEELPLGVSYGPCALLRVSDDGPGIPTDLQERLFEPFVSGRSGGSGLGLAIVQRAVLAHRGVVLVDSMPGSDTVFSVVLPAKGSSEVAA
jgi:two-component system sensor histidine kinase PilS (NtrC family)